MRFIVVVGSTRTAAIDGISAAGADPELMRHTPAADAEIVEYGRPISALKMPVSPTGCPTPAVVTRAVHELVRPDVLVVDAGLETPTVAPTTVVGTEPGADIRDSEPVPQANDVFETARELGRNLPDDELIIGESIPGGTTTALGVLAALGEPYGVSSSLPENPLELKRSVVSTALSESGLERSDAAGEPTLAVEKMGDPVLAAVSGLATGTVEAGGSVTLAGGTQMVAAGALLRHFGIQTPLELATTSFVATDETSDIESAARALDFDLTVTNPEFDRSTHPAMEGYSRGEAKEGVGMGGALLLAAREGIPMDEIRAQSERRYDSLVDNNGS